MLWLLASISHGSGEQRANIITQVLQVIRDTGILVCSLTFDAAASNMSMARILGCNFTPRGITSLPPHPITGDPVHVLLDPLYLLKLVRSTLGDMKVLKDEEGNMEGLHLANKLRDAHMEWRWQKIKVKLAAQVLSDSVADALSVCSCLKLTEFRGSDPLCIYLKMFNHLFDDLNSRNYLQKGWKKPIHSGNFELVSLCVFSVLQA
ncbi:uncharacterized protein LOC124153205 [Ischnura elegans]|uniref:uncharacterized protein LOC124153205 n=1 Tax=Ischnura elegans TaxID=197161 RepID=UPI001ED8AB26|nr:uncharacterized protein LOC124153205 [Ischnura elegans]